MKKVLQVTCCMLHVKKTRIFFASLLILQLATCNLQPTSLHAASFSNKAKGTTSAQFLKLPVSARATALGEAFSAAVEDASAISFNPAALTFTKEPSLSLLHAAYIDPISYDYLALSYQIDSRNFVGTSLQHLSAGSIDQTNEVGVKTGTFNPKDSAFALGYAYQLPPLNGFFGHFTSYSMGASVKVISSQIVNKDQTFALDVGVLSPSYKIFSKNTRFAFALQNLGGGLKLDQASDPLPLAIKIGGSARVSDPLQIATEFTFPRDNNPQLAVGGEYLTPLVHDWTLASRLGFNSRTIGDIGFLSCLSFGFGVLHKPFNFDYALTTMGDLGLTHRLSFGVTFPKSKEVSPLAKEAEKNLKQAKKLFNNGDILASRRAYKTLASLGSLNPYPKEVEKDLERIDHELKTMSEQKRKQLAGEAFLKGVNAYEGLNYLKARQEFEDVLTLVPDHPEARSYLDKIESPYKRLSMEQASIAFSKAEDAFYQGNYTLAIDLYNQVLTLDPKHASAAIRLQEAQKMLEAKEKAAAQTQPSVEQTNKITLLLGEAKNLIRKQKDREALEKISELLKLDPLHAEAQAWRRDLANRIAGNLYQEGLRLTELGRLEEAIVKFETATDFGHADAVRALATTRAQLKAQNSKKAQELNQQALRIYSQGKIEESITIWDTAQKLDPDNENIKQNLETAIR